MHTERNETRPASGPLVGLKVVEFGGIGPAPFCAMLLADAGAEMIRLDRTESIDLGIAMEARFDVTRRGRRSVALDLKRPAGIAAAKRLIAAADVLLEGFRPGVMERLGLGPETCLALNPRLVYGRMTGWGQAGPLADKVGHDIDYIALAGALHAVGTTEAPLPPLNLVGDYGGGALYLAFGVMAALFEAGRSGRGQVVDAAMLDGAASLMAPTYGMLASGFWRDRRAANLLDGGAPWYGCYQTKDGRWMAVGAIEQRFYDALLRGLGLDPATLPDRNDEAQHALLRRRFAEAFLTRSAAEWTEVFADGVACVAPVLSLAEAPQHPHARARGLFLDLAGVRQPAPAPRFARTPGAVQRPPQEPGQGTRAALADWGFSDAEIEALIAEGAAAER